MSAGTYNVNFFTPKTEAARANMRMVVTMLIIWAVAVFGFQFLLIAMNKPTPEPVLADFTRTWTATTAGNATPADQQTLARTLLMVLGKNVALKPDHRTVLKNALASTLLALGVTGNDATAAASAIGLGNTGYDPLLAAILKSSFVENPTAVLADADKTALPTIMNLYLIHNRSVLTDTRFLGFPFHYWYTAQFLLILFVGLCFAFCRYTDSANVRFNLETPGNDDDSAPVAEPEPVATAGEKREE